MKHQINIRPAFTLKILLGIIAVLFTAHFMYLMTMFVYGYSYRTLFKIFNFNDEANIPTYYSVMAILFAALLLLIVGMLKRVNKVKDGNFWIALSGIFTFLAYDEAAEVHENFNNLVRPYLPESSYDFLYWAWVVPYAVLTIAVVFSFAAFLFRLPRKTALYFMVSGAIFVTGAIGLELFNSYYWINEGQKSLGLHLAFTLEELFEMTGIALFIYSILDYMRDHMGEEFVFSLNNKAKQADLKSNVPKNGIKREETLQQQYDVNQDVEI